MKGLIKLENTQAQMRKGILEMCVLSIIAAGEAYPSDIINELKKDKSLAQEGQPHPLLVKEGTLYPLLSRLKNAGLLAYKWKEVEGKGPPRKYYTLTDSGRDFLNALLHTWEVLALAVQKTTENIKTYE